MLENSYLKDFLGNLGIAIDEINSKEILFKFTIFYNRKNKKYILSDNYILTHQDSGTIIADFLNTDFTNKSDFIHFFNNYYLLILSSSILKSFIKTKEYSEDEYNSFIDIVMKKYSKTLIKIQQDIDVVLSYCIYDPNENTKNLTPFDRLCVLEAIPCAKPQILYSHKIERLTLNAIFETDDYSESNLCELINKSKVKTYNTHLFLPKDINSLLYLELVEVLKNNIILKNCKLCSRCFIANSIKTEYCNNIAPGYQNKTCSEVGRNKVYMKKIEKDDALSLYIKIYRHKAYMNKVNKDIEKYKLDYEKFKKTAKIKIKAYKNKKLSKEDFVKWLNKNK